MSAPLVEEIYYNPNEDENALHGKMETVIENAVELLPDSGIFLLVVDDDDANIRIAHMSNLKPQMIYMIMKKWLERQEKSHEGNSPN